MPGSQLLNMVKTDLRAKHYSERTEKTYINWIRSYIIFHNKQHPKDLGTEEIKKFINNLADEGKVSAATQNQALNSILYFYKNILRKDIKWIENIKYALRKKHLPTEWL
jgi:site-specific recombinase XerD